VDGITILESANPAYEPIEVKDEDIEFLHQVAWIKPAAQK
jgi:phage repressor protein C with HTH and peptisase S24 domain